MSTQTDSTEETPLCNEFRTTVDANLLGWEILAESLEKRLRVEISDRDTLAAENDALRKALEDCTVTIEKNRLAIEEAGLGSIAHEMFFVAENGRTTLARSSGANAAKGKE